MDSVYALRLSRAAREAARGGDFIDHGWSLVKALHAAGFDIVPREPINHTDPRRTLNEMCGLLPASIPETSASLGRHKTEAGCTVSVDLMGAYCSDCGSDDFRGPSFCRSPAERDARLKERGASPDRKETRP